MKKFFGARNSGPGNFSFDGSNAFLYSICSTNEEEAIIKVLKILNNEKTEIELSKH
ncbi:hypothetical protein [Niabella drilacis]|uniref:Uncharacterized protein n=1 Tax=Niabella drilacis (strain DSM 25811 / CCM 8410 / CCUG 62505 / LMG 26954 / E90) TaxID=1285928 RepID=A0A1G7B066_NIADE|nr:hypothetical protein [Niabella drilacis]SDE20508.1 hypothetical protein SAMN04487894_12628 [Niabella drilacis]